MPALRLSDESVTCPYMFPFQVGRRDHVIAGLRRHGIAASFWPTLPREVKGNPAFPQANLIASELVALPVHQDLSERDMRRMAGALKQVLS